MTTLKKLRFGNSKYIILNYVVLYCWLLQLFHIAKYEVEESQNPADTFFLNSVDNIGYK